MRLFWWGNEPRNTIYSEYFKTGLLQVLNNRIYLEQLNYCIVHIMHSVCEKNNCLVYFFVLKYIFIN